MTDTTPATHPTLLDRAKAWIAHEANALTSHRFLIDLVEHVRTLEARIVKLEGVAVKDAPAVAHAVAEVAPVAVQVADDVTKAAGA